LWHEYLKTRSKVVVENLIKQEKMFTINENFFGKNYLFLVAPLHPNSCMHPVYKWGQAVNLSANIEELQKLNYQDLKKEMKKSPRFYKTIKANKAPIILDKSLAMKIDPYKKIGESLLNKRAELMKKNEKFSQDICNILKEAAEEKMETASQEDIEPEESIYSGGFISPKDEALFPKFHSSQ
jgi:exodeoxyribonuclease-1